jgi:putative membrane-bound dehydrogenase-like protein
MFARLLPAALFLTLPAPAVRAAEPVPPSLFTLSDPTLEVTVWAHSPLFFNPTNIDIDKDGCLWVAEGVNYRKHFDRKPEGDRIMVLRDNDGDGKADESWPFVQEPFLRAPLGVAVIGNKVVVSMAPDLVVYTDKDGDKKFDPAKGDTREVLLTGFNGRNHDHSLHSMTVGPDGKWYFSAGNCGAKFTDKSGKTFRIGSKQNTSWWPKDPNLPDGDPNEYAGQKSDDGKVYVGGFIARMNPDGTNVEILAHNLRNSYENCVTSFGDIFASDNDDQPACRVFGVLEGGNYGFASADGSRSWQVDRRPGQDIKTATWRQEDPGVAPAGDVYGGGAPTGIVFYENGALGPQHEGTLLSCESARNTIFGYKPQPDGAGWKLERFDFLTTNKEGKIIGTDSTGGNQTAKAEDTKTLFRPSDIVVGPDGALYISDWYDPRTGGHADMDDSVSGTIYRVAPKGFKSVVPKFDVATVQGAVEALKSPAVHVRAVGAETIKGRRTEAKNSIPESQTVVRMVNDGARKVMASGDFVKARFTQAIEQWGTADIHINSPGMYHIIRDIDLSITSNIGWLSGMLDEGIFEDNGDGRFFGSLDAPQNWTEKFAILAWWLHPPQSIPAFKTRALSPSLPLKARKDALTAIGYNTGADAAQAMLGIAEALGSSTAAGTPEAAVKDTALWWLLNRKDNVWKDHGLATALKEKGIYDPDKIVLTAVSLPDPPPAAFTVEDALKLTGDATRGAAVSQRCYMCHQIGKEGAEFGPELTTWGHTQGTEVILRSLIDPGADIAHGFEGMRIETTDNLQIDGLILTDADPVVIRSTGGLTQTVPKAKIKSKKPLGRSLMMSATQLGLTAQECADLAAFLRK